MHIIEINDCFSPSAPLTDYKIKRAPRLCEMEMWNVHEILMIDPATHTHTKGWTMQRAMVATTFEPLCHAHSMSAPTAKWATTIHTLGKTNNCGR